MKKILFSVMGVVLCLGLMGGAFAYFSDVETSEDNTFTAGTIDLALNGENPKTGPIFTFSDIKPCEELAPITIRLENVGNNEGVLYTCIKYNELDNARDTDPTFEYAAGDSGSINAAWELTADQFAAILYVAAVTYQYRWPADPERQPEGYIGSVHDDLPNWLLIDTYYGNQDGYVSLYELKKVSPIPYDTNNDPLPATASIEYIVTFHLADSLVNWGDVDSNIVTGVPDNRPQADGIEFIVSGILLQVGAPTPPACP